MNFATENYDIDYFGKVITVEESPRAEVPKAKTF